MPADDWPVLDAAPALSLRITGTMPPLSPALDAAVERHWQAANARHNLFNGQVFCADHIAPDVIEGHWTEYRRVLAQFTDPALIPALNIRSLAVCGALNTPDGIAIARRSRHAVYQPSEWQLPPAGSVDSTAAEPGGASWRRAILAELDEELGLPATAITAMRPLCLVQHPTGVLDLGIELRTPWRADAIHAAFRARADAEYEDLLILPPATLPARIATRGGRLVPPARAFLARLGPGNPAHPQASSPA